MQNVQTPLTLRQRRIQTSEKLLSLKEGQHLSIADLDKLIEQGDQILHDCGPFDPAYEHLHGLNYRFRVLRYQLQAEQFNLDVNFQSSLESALGQEYLKMFHLTEDQLLDAASVWEKKISVPSTNQFNKKLYIRMRDTLMKFIDWRAEQSCYKETRQ